MATSLSRAALLLGSRLHKDAQAHLKSSALPVGSSSRQPIAASLSTTKKYPFRQEFEELTDDERQHFQDLANARNEDREQKGANFRASHDRGAMHKTAVGAHRANTNLDQEALRLVKDLNIPLHEDSSGKTRDVLHGARSTKYARRSHAVGRGAEAGLGAWHASPQPPASPRVPPVDEDPAHFVGVHVSQEIVEDLDETQA
mmetsp:Transcript_6993/g.19042  ORF Transcript_6993/g.19042 Transcript_6993/m.19042 type:complete len:201 (+) Transcript_6993:204-806(+)